MRENRVTGPPRDLTQIRKLIRSHEPRRFATESRPSWPVLWWLNRSAPPRPRAPWRLVRFADRLPANTFVQLPRAPREWFWPHSLYRHRALRARICTRDAEASRRDR